MNPALSSLPPILQALSVLAHAHRVQGDPARSALLLEAVDHLHPNDPGVLLALAAAELSAARPQQALAALERLAMAGSADGGGAFHLLRAQALVALDRREEAQLAMRAALDLRRGAEVVA